VLTGFFVASFDSPGERNFFLRCQQFHLANLAEIKMQGVAAWRVGLRWWRWLGFCDRRLLALNIDRW
jgi:hypothetical protein